MTTRTQPYNYKSVLVCGLTGTGKSTLAQMIADAFDLRKFSVGDHFREVYAERHPNKEISINEFFIRITDKERNDAVAKVRAMVDKGGFVVDIREPNANPNITLILRLVADKSTRVKRVSWREEYKNKPLKEVRRLVEANDQNDREFSLRIFGYNIDDPALYHATLNTRFVSQAQSLEAVRAFMTEKQ